MKTSIALPPTRSTEAFRLNLIERLIAVVVIAYSAYALSQLGFSLSRFLEGVHNSGRFLSRMFPPDFSKGDILWKGIAESLQIAVLASTLGIVLSLPIGLFGARNLMPSWVTWIARFLVALCRSLHPVIVAILFVKAVGFGALAGILALVVASIGFVGKLFSEAIEEISPKQIEAIRATGASFMNVIFFGVLPDA